MNDERVKGSSIGQFDLIKGIGIICIIMKHSIGIFESDLMLEATVTGTILGIVVRVFNNMIMPAFFIISGFGFRKESPGVSIKRQARFLLLPYSIVMVITVFMNLIIHYATFHYKKGAVTETVKVLGGFMLGAARNINIGNVTLYANGACWYLLALFISWIILELIFHYGGKRQALLVAVTVVIGWILSMINPEFPFGIPQAMIGVGYLYIGYEIKKNRWLFTPLQIWKYIVMVIISLISVIWGNVIMASNVWKLGLFDIVANALYAMLFIKIMLLLNNYKNIVMNAISYLGRMSLWIICLHTIEFIAVPWYLFNGHFNNIFGGISLIIVIRSFIIAVGMVLLIVWNKSKIERKRKHGGVLWTE